MKIKELNKKAEAKRQEALAKLDVIMQLRVEYEDGTLNAENIETGHRDADGILCELLTELGCEDVVAKFYNVKKMY